MLKILNKFEAVFASSLLAIMAVVTIVQIVFRYFISYSLAWPEELSRFLFVASVYVGSSYAEQENRHLAITILRTSCGKFLARFLPILVQIIVVIFSGAMTLWGYDMVMFMKGTGQLATALDIPMYFVFGALPLGFGCMTIRAFVNLIKYIKNDPSLTAEQG